MNHSVFLWLFLFLYGFVVFIAAPKIVGIRGFFSGVDEKGNEASLLLLSTSTFISWIFAKSVTNAANLGAQYGIVGGFAYAVYWLCIPLSGLLIWRLRRRFQAKGIVSFLNTYYGRSAAAVFSLAIFIRLFNSVWSNSTVVGGYFGASQTTTFIVATLLFTIVTAAYSIKGGLRSAMVTDFVQTLIFLVFLIFTFVTILPARPVSDYLSSGTWTLEGGVDLLLVSFIQIFSYPFHDPVLTDRGFITDEKKMLKSFFISGIGGFIIIILFSLIGVYSALEGIPVTDNVPVQVAMTFGSTAFLFMAIVMMTSAGSTLDSAFSSLAKLIAIDVPHFANISISPERAKRIGQWTILIFAVIGNLPIFFGSNILAATTISGTMVIGFAPIFCLHGLVKPTKAGFHLSFWTGIILGLLYSFNLIPSFMAIGNGDSALLLGVNLYGSLLAAGLYILAGIVGGKRSQRELEEI